MFVLICYLFSQSTLAFADKDCFKYKTKNVQIKTKQTIIFVNAYWCGVPTYTFAIRKKVTKEKIDIMKVVSLIVFVDSTHGLFFNTGEISMFELGYRNKAELLNQILSSNTKMYYLRKYIERMSFSNDFDEKNLKMYLKKRIDDKLLFNSCIYKLLLEIPKNSKQARQSFIDSMSTGFININQTKFRNISDRMLKSKYLYESLNDFELYIDSPFEVYDREKLEDIMKKYEIEPAFKYYYKKFLFP